VSFSSRLSLPFSRYVDFTFEICCVSGNGCSGCGLIESEKPAEYNDRSDMIRRAPTTDVDSRKLLVERVASSPYLNRSARLRDLFLYLCERVLEESADEIHEREVGHKVFGRPLDYDAVADNIVRVHASMLRKRVAQYFSTEGSQESIVVDIPKGNYAPVFRERPLDPQSAPIASAPVPRPRVDLRIWLLAGLLAIFVCSTVFLLFRNRLGAQRNISLLADKPAVRQFWSQIFRPDKPADIVLDDAALAFFQELTSHQVALSEYFDRSYLRTLDDSAVTAKLGRNIAGPLVLKRYSSYAGAALLWRLAQTAGALQSEAKIHFARDYSFREVKAGNAILLGNSRSNPWIEPFESHLAVRWKFDDARGGYYPMDTSLGSADQEKFRIAAQGDEPREGFAAISLLPNLSGSGHVLIISGTGGAAIGTVIDFLTDDHSVSRLRSLIPQTKTGEFPYFEALLRVKIRSSLPRDTSVVICRDLHL